MAQPNLPSPDQPRDKACSLTSHQHCLILLCRPAILSCYQPPTHQPPLESLSPLLLLLGTPASLYQAHSSFLTGALCSSITLPTLRRGRVLSSSPPARCLPFGSRSQQKLAPQRVLVQRPETSPAHSTAPAGRSLRLNMRGIQEGNAQHQLRSETRPTCHCRRSPWSSQQLSAARAPSAAAVRLFTRGPLGRHELLRSRTSSPRP